MSSSDESRPDEATTSGVGLVSDDSPAQPTDVVEPAYATWQQRVLATLLDNAILAGVTWLALGAGFAQPTLTPGIGVNGDEGWTGGALILVPICALVILLVLQAVTGWTPGKLVVGIRVVRERSSGPAGPWTTLVRWVLHLLDAILLIGYLRPLWDAKRQTFADTIAHTIVVRELPDLPRRPRIALYSAALVICVLGIGYGYVPINSIMGSPVDDDSICELEGPGPFLTTGDIALAGSVSVERDRRMWTVRETRVAHPGATISWESDPSVRDVDYRIELDARPASENAPVVSRSWDIGPGGMDNPSEDGSFTHNRTLSPDVHEARVEIADSDDEVAELGTDVWMDVRLIADDEVVAECGSALDYDAVGGAANE